MLTPGLFFLGPVAIAAGAAALASLLGAGTAGSLIVFIVCSIASLLFLRPIARRHVRLPALSRTGTDALIGRKAVVTKQVDALGGRVRVGGEEWSARAYLDGKTFQEGQTVDIIQIEGVTALVAE
jgi:membrane protein implicated in regulation of membrane protease activity